MRPVYAFRLKVLKEGPIEDVALGSVDVEHLIFQTGGAPC